MNEKILELVLDAYVNMNTMSTQIENNHNINTSLSFLEAQIRTIIEGLYK